jgi:hypothetical protein
VARDLARHARQRLHDSRQWRGAQFESAALEFTDDAVHPVESDG